MAGRLLKVAPDASSDSIIAQLGYGEVVHVECKKRPFSTWHDAYAKDATGLDAIRNDSTLTDFTFYAMSAKEALDRQRPFR